LREKNHSLIEENESLKQKLNEKDNIESAEESDEENKVFSSIFLKASIYLLILLY